MAATANGQPGHSKSQKRGHAPKTNSASGAMMENGKPWKDKKPIDAGMRRLDHYASRLPKWRYHLRQKLIPIVRLETPYLALLQEKLRSPLLDTYFALSANLGTHTFFMIILPIIFWCGSENWARAMTRMLANGVFWSGVLKDLLCLPRPLSPPLVRITMSGSAALEYGFPSTHATNATSVVVYVLHALHSIPLDERTTTHTVLMGAFYWYAFSIVLGRLYCGMHGIFDVVVGAILGAAIAVVEIAVGLTFNRLFNASDWRGPMILALICLVLVRTHPEPADNCPCFDDSVAFAAVLIGMETGCWHLSKTVFANPDISSLGYLIMGLRIVLGVFIVFAWRGLMKPTLLKVLPPLFRVIEQLGVDIPRKFFLKASQYSYVPALRKDDNIIPPAFEIPGLLAKKLSNPLRRRAISIGPQSEADAWETIAYREKRRRDSLTLTAGMETIAESTSTSANTGEKTPTAGASFSSGGGSDNDGGNGTKKKKPGTPIRIVIPSPAELLSAPVQALPLPSPLSASLETYEKMMGSTGPEAFPDFYATPMAPPTIPNQNRALLTPNGTSLGIGIRAGATLPGVFPGFDAPVTVSEAQEREAERVIFDSLERPRVRYDVEVVTKLIVYAGIAWLASEGNLLLFELMGLGVGSR